MAKRRKNDNTDVAKKFVSFLIFATISGIINLFVLTFNLIFNQINKNAKKKSYTHLNKLEKQEIKKGFYKDYDFEEEVVDEDDYYYED